MQEPKAERVKQYRATTGSNREHDNAAGTEFPYKR